MCDEALLALALVLQEKWEEARLVYESRAERLRSAKNQILTVRKNALLHAIRFFEGRGDKASAARWRAKLDTLPK